MANRSLSPSAPVIGSRYAEQKRSRSSPNDREPVDYGSPADAADDPATKAPDASRACPASATHRPEPTGPLSPPVLPILKKPTGSVVENSLLKQVLSPVRVIRAVRWGSPSIHGMRYAAIRSDTQRYAAIRSHTQPYAAKPKTSCQVPWAATTSLADFKGTILKPSFLTADLLTYVEPRVLLEAL